VGGLVKLLLELSVLLVRAEKTSQYIKVGEKLGCEEANLRNTAGVEGSFVNVGSDHCGGILSAARSIEQEA